MFNVYSTLDYLKIDIANAFGLDKLQFEERIQWFDNNLAETLVTQSTEEIKQFLSNHSSVENIPQAFTGILAYKDYFYNKPSGYLCSLDAISSGASLMSCLTADTKGLENTGLLGTKRKDLYTELFNTFKRVYPQGNTRTRQDSKKACMTFLYGSMKVPLSIFGETEEMFNAYVYSMNQECNGALALRNLLVNLWDDKATEHNWVLPDGFRVNIPVLVEENFNYSKTFGDTEFTLPFTLKVRGTKKSSVSNAGNLVHSVDSLIVREMLRRTQYDPFTLGEVLTFLETAPNSLISPISIKEMNQLGKLGELIYLYESSGFCSVRIVEYLTQPYHALKLSKKHRDKLKSILSLLVQQPTFELLTIHDCFKAKPKYMNYVRYWYKELCADIVESNLLPFLVNQIAPRKKLINDPIEKNVRLKV